MQNITPANIYVAQVGLNTNHVLDQEAVKKLVTITVKKLHSDFITVQ